jgi:hypothetical protein
MTTEVVIQFVEGSKGLSKVEGLLLRIETTKVETERRLISQSNFKDRLLEKSDFYGDNTES